MPDKLICEKHGCEKRYMGQNFAKTRDIYDCMTCSSEKSKARRELYKGYDSLEDAFKAKCAAADKLADMLERMQDLYERDNGRQFEPANELIKEYRGEE